MRKITFFLMFVLFASVLKANDEVMLTMTAEPGKTLDFSIYFAEPSQTLNVDWGDIGPRPLPARYPATERSPCMQHRDS